MAAIRATLTAWAARRPQLALAVGLAAVAAAGWLGYRAWDAADFRAAVRPVREAAEQRQWRKAQELVKEPLRGWPDRAELLLLAARVERRCEELEKAKKHLDAAQRVLGSETHAIKVERALLELHAGQLAAAEGFLRECVRQDDPDSPEILDILAGAYEIGYRVADAQRALDELLRRQPDHFDALVRRGRAAQTMGWYEDAAGYYEKALALRPDVDPVRGRLAETLGTAGRFDKARAQFEQLLKGQPDSGSLRFGLALCLAGTGEPDKAMRIYDDLLRLNPNNWMALLERGKLSVQLDRPEAGLEDLRKADSLAPPDQMPTALVNCLVALGRAEEAKPYQAKVDRILADRKRSSDLGDLLRERGGDDPAPRHEIGVILLRLGKQQEGVHWLRQALEKDPRHRPSHEALAAFFESVNAASEAAHHRRALQQLGGR
jgi:tetratricopeptide (TPR) repeat protein